MPKTDLEIRGGGGGGKGLPKNFFGPLALPWVPEVFLAWASVWSKNKGVAWAPPLDPPIQMHHAGLQ